MVLARRWLGKSPPSGDGGLPTPPFCAKSQNPARVDGLVDLLVDDYCVAASQRWHSIVESLFEFRDGLIPRV